VLEITPDGFLLKETAPGVTIEEIKSRTLGRLVISRDVSEMKL
jgi:3-oxoacid CoA-transferase subunit B